MTAPRSRHRSLSGFTLVELMIVVVILGILAAIVVPVFFNATREARVKATLTELSKLRRHIEVYRIRHAGSPPAITDGDGTWGQIVGPDHLNAPPTNSYVGGAVSRTIIIRDTPDDAFPTTPTYGWIYSPSLDEVWPAGFSPSDEPYPEN